MRILLSAYYCDPYGVSEYYVGFRFWNLLKEKHDVHLITDSFKKPQWERYLAHKPELLKKIHFVNLGMVYKIIPRLFNIPYYIYNIKAWFLARTLMRECEFDLIHHVTASMFRFPVFLSGLNAPFVWGPIGGAVPEPSGFENLFGGDRFDRRFRKFDKYIAKYDPMIHSTMANASRILVATGHFFDMFPEQYHGKMRKFSLCGFDSLDTPVDTEAVSAEPGTPVDLLFVGRIVPYKGLQFALKAIAKVSRTMTVRLRVAGSGPYLEQCKDLALSLGIEDCVEFLGKIPQERVLKIMEASDIYLIPSLRESWGISPMEAMSRSLPVIGIDNGGLSEVLHESSSILIEPLSEEQVVSDLTSAIERLGKNPSLRKAMGEAGKKRVATRFSWEKIGTDLELMYKEAVEEFSARRSNDHCIEGSAS